MGKIENEHKKLFDEFAGKASLKQDVYNVTLQGFNNLKETLIEYVGRWEEYSKNARLKHNIPFEFLQNNDLEVELKFGGDVLIFLMHSNIFEFPRDHEIMKTGYIKDDKTRSYHGIINIYNFLADSFKYNRINDVGYLIGRVFINKDGAYFIEGKQELAFLYNNFGTKKFDKPAIEALIEASIQYSINFDLLTPPYNEVMNVTVNEIRSTLESFTLKTGKRLGFKFYADTPKID